MARYWFMALAAGVASALVTGLAGAGTLSAMLLVYFAQLPLFLVGLSMGATAAAIAGAAGAVTMIPLAGLMTGLGYAVVSAAPVVLLTRQALLWRETSEGVEWYPVGLLVMWLTAFAAATLTVVCIVLALQPEGLEGTVRLAVQRFIDLAAPGQPAELRETFAASIAPLLPGIAAASWMLVLVVNGALSQGILSRFGQSQRPAADFVTMSFPRIFPLLAAAAVVLGLLPGAAGFYGDNLAAVFVIPFFLLGLTVVHAICRKSSAGPVLLFALYALMIFQAWLVLIVAVVGVVEQLTRFRQRVA